MKRSLFKHTTQLRVRNYEVDWQGIVHNANYLLYCETGRVEYLKHLGITLDLNSIRHENRVVLVRNEINYRSPACFDDQLIIRTRISAIGDTSFTFESMIEKSKARVLVCENIAIHVWLNSAGKPKRVGNDFRRIVAKFEGRHLRVEN